MRVGCGLEVLKAQQNSPSRAWHLDQKSECLWTAVGGKMRISRTASNYSRKQSPASGTSH